MSTSLFHASSRRRTTPGGALFSRRLMVEQLEERALFSVALPAALGGGGATFGQQAISQDLKVAKHAPTTMLPLTITGVTTQAGQLVALASLGSHTFTLPIELGTTPNPADPDCPILNLELGEIHLDLLGLNVDTSRICLDIEADPGPGNLLGNLLCGVSHLLDGGVDLDTILGGLTSTQLTDVTNGLTSILNGVFGQLTSSAAVTGVSDSDVGHCDILNLSLGPIDLNLLGLEVHLDNCEDGPVTVDITAEPGSGKLLGNLLCSVVHLLDGPGLGNPGLQNLLGRIGGLIDDLL
jgi:hypothetical protein